MQPCTYSTHTHTHSHPNSGASDLSSAAQRKGRLPAYNSPLASFSRVGQQTNTNSQRALPPPSTCTCLPACPLPCSRRDAMTAADHTMNHTCSAQRRYGRQSTHPFTVQKRGSSLEAKPLPWPSPVPNVAFVLRRRPVRWPIAAYPSLPPAAWPVPRLVHASA